MSKVLRILRDTREVLITVGAVLAAAIVAVETYEALRKKVDAARSS
jgi:biopolymer transport protein ExbB/TolQ